MFTQEKGGEIGYFGALLPPCAQVSVSWDSGSLCGRGSGADTSGDDSEHKVLIKVMSCLWRFPASLHWLRSLCSCLGFWIRSQTKSARVLFSFSSPMAFNHTTKPLQNQLDREDPLSPTVAFCWASHKETRGEIVAELCCAIPPLYV